MCDADLMANTPQPEPLDLAKIRKNVPIWADCGETYYLAELAEELVAEVERLRDGIAAAAGWTDSGGECGQRLYNLLNGDVVTR